MIVLVVVWPLFKIQGWKSWKSRLQYIYTSTTAHRESQLLDFSTQTHCDLLDLQDPVVHLEMSTSFGGKYVFGTSNFFAD